MRKTFHLGDPSRSKRMEDKLNYMEGTAEQLLQENHRLKTQLFVNKRTYEDLFSEFVANIRSIRLCVVADNPGDTPAEEFTKTAKQVILTCAQTKRTMSQLQAELNACNQSLIRSKQQLSRAETQLALKESQLEQMRKEGENAYISRLNNLRAENHRQQILIDELKRKLETVSSQSASITNELNLKVQGLTNSLARTERQLNNQLKETVETHAKDVRKLKQEFEQSKQKLIDSYCKVIEVKKEENKALMRALSEANPFESNIHLESFQTMELQDMLNKEIEELRRIESGHCLQIDQLDERIESLEKRLLESKTVNEKKQAEIEQLSVCIDDLRRNCQDKDQQVQSLILQLEEERKNKQEHDKLLGRKWEDQIDKVIRDHQIKARDETNAVRSEYEKRYSTQIIGLNCEILSHKEKQQELTSKISGFVYEINQLEEAKTLRDETIRQLQQQYIEQKSRLENIIVSKDKLIEAAHAEVTQREAQIAQLKEVVRQKEENIKSLIEENEREREKAQNELHELEQQYKLKLYLQKIEAENQKEDALKFQKEELVDRYDSIIDRLKLNYEEQLDNLRTSRDLIISNYEEAKRETEEHHSEELERLRNEERQIKWNMEAKLREERQKHKEVSQVAAAEILALKIDLGRVSKISEEQAAKIIQLEATIVDNGKIRDKLVVEIGNLKQTIEGLEQEISGLHNVIQQREIAIKMLQEEVVVEKTRYSNVTEEISQARCDLRGEISALQAKHQRMESFYKSQSRRLQNYIVSRPNQQSYLKEIEELKRQRASLDDNLVRCEAELIKVQEVSKYKDGELENLKEKLKVVKVESTKATAHKRVHTESSGFNTAHQPLIFGSQQLLNKTNYERFSTSRKGRRHYKVVEMSGFKGGLANYSVINSIKPHFRLHSPLNSGRPKTHSKS